MFLRENLDLCVCACECKAASESILLENQYFSTTLFLIIFFQSFIYLGKVHWEQSSLFQDPASLIKGLAQGHPTGGNEGGAGAVFHFPQPDLYFWC